MTGLAAPRLPGDPSNLLTTLVVYFNYQDKYINRHRQHRGSKRTGCSLAEQHFLSTHMDLLRSPTTRAPSTNQPTKNQPTNQPQTIYLAC